MKKILLEVLSWLITIAAVGVIMFVIWCLYATFADAAQLRADIYMRPMFVRG